MSGAPAFTLLTYSYSEHVCTITLNRPEKRNALSAALVNELIVALETAAEDDATRVIVLTGAGGAFCAGGDLSQMAGGQAAASEIPWRGGFAELNLVFASIAKPTIAKVRRFALGGGLGLMCACTFAIAEDSATFGTPEIKRGLFPMMIMANIFRTVPRRRGLEMILLGERLGAVEAVSLGLLNRAVPQNELDRTVEELAAKLVDRPPQVMRLGLEAFRRQDDLNLAEALPYLNDMLMRCFETEDAKEGLMAFLQKRPPVWK